MAHRVLHDPLTDLPNRTLFFDRLGWPLPACAQPDSIAVLFIDLDDFKVVNDSLGTEPGQAARRARDALREAMRPSDTIAASAGMSRRPVRGHREARDAVIVAQRIVEATAVPFELEGRDMYVTTSVGVALAIDSEATPETLLRDADAAMYRAKERGPGRVESSTKAMRARIMSAWSSRTACAARCTTTSCASTTSRDVALGQPDVAVEACALEHPSAACSSRPSSCRWPSRPG